ncbi:hypothetical protein [Mesorhizobium sp. Cs1299R1N3]|uniref:hypothetical protein n=1 Tax=Mesorhizobium sp. Cs1299R1N3 TaxID=3015173 RepID=UPI00301B8410
MSGMRNCYRVIAGAADQGWLGLAQGRAQKKQADSLEQGQDFRDKAYCEDLVDYAVQAVGRLDVLLNKAGIISRGQHRRED